MSLSCNNVQDYVTLYKDGVLSDETCAQVEEHLADCKECKAFYREYDGMNTSVPETEEIAPCENADYAAVAEKIRRKKTASVLLAAAGVLAMMAGTAYLSHLLFPRDKK